MTRSKNIVDSFMTGLFHDAKNAVDSVTNNQKGTFKGSGSYQDQNRITKGPDKDQISIRSVSDKYHDKGSSKDHQRITTELKAKRIIKGSGFISLSKSQTKVYLWFKQKGQSGVFNKPEIEHSLSMPYITIRKAVKKLEDSGVLGLKYDTCQKIYEYKIENEHILKLSKTTKNVSGSYQDQDNIISPPLISSSSFIKKTTTQNCDATNDTLKIIANIMSMDPEYKFWLDQQVTPKQVLGWKYEFGLNLETILNNLCYARWQIVNHETKIKKSAADYVYKIMQKNGGAVNKPSKYKTMAQLDLEFYEIWKKGREKHLLKIKQIKEDIIKTKIEPKANALLENFDIENKYIKAAVNNIKSEPRKGKIKRCMKSGKELDNTSKNVLKNYLIEILSGDTLKELN